MQLNGKLDLKNEVNELLGLTLSVIQHTCKLLSSVQIKIDEYTTQFVN